MTTDEQNNISGNPSDETQPQPAVGAIEEVAGAQSRRKFLRLAVVSGATVATVGATAGIAAAHPHTGILTNLGITNPFGASAQANCTLKMEGSGLDGNCFTSFTYKSSNGQTNPGTFYLFFTVHSLPAGSYTMTITRNPGSHDIGDSPWSYQGSNSVKLYQRNGGSASDCPNFSGTLPTDQVRSGNTVSDVFATCYTLDNTKSNIPADLQFAAHLTFDGTGLTGNIAYTFSAVIKDCDGNTICTPADLTVTAQEK